MKSINEYNNIIQNICKEFTDKYFEWLDWYIIGDANVWFGPLEIANYYFSIDNVICALNNNIPEDVLLKWYDESLEEYKKDRNVKINLYNYYLKNK